MHLVIAFAAPLTDSADPALQSMATPTLERLLARWAVTQRDDADASTLSPPHERALARAFGWSGADGCLPWASHHAAADGVAVGAQAWGLLTPTHWRIGSDGVHLADPEALALSDADSRALFDALQPLFASEGYTLAWGAALRWYAAHASLQGLATASLDRVIGRNIDAWIPRQPQARPLRRLQNEAQMLLHGHPLNEAREAAGQLPVNSFWLSGCGAFQGIPDHGVQLDDRLRGPALRGDGPAWLAAWQGLDRDALAPVLAAAARGEPARLTLCGERCSVELAPHTGGWWQRIAGRLTLPRPVLRTVLESL
ncbi:MAG: hypothetical protein V4792_05920 [Pseudomonadota bacterium]